MGGNGSRLYNVFNMVRGAHARSLELSEIIVGLGAERGRAWGNQC